MRSAGLVVGLAVAGVLSELLVGPAGWGWPSDPFIAWQLRLPRLMLALGAGAGLAACGVLLQVLLRNPLASPYTLGVGSASALGASLVLVALPTFHVGPGAWLGSARRDGARDRHESARRARRRDLDPVRRRRCALRFSGRPLLHFLADRATSAAMIRWTMGGLASVGMTQGLLGLLPTCLGALWLFKVIPQLNLLSLSDDWALSRGVATERLQVTILVVVALWTGAIVAQAGPIAFVGLIKRRIWRAAALVTTCAAMRPQRSVSAQGYSACATHCPASS